MKSPIVYMLLLWAATYCLNSCSNATITSTDIAVIVDKTDRMTAYPNANDIISQLGLQDNPWQGVRITTTYISDRDINDVTVVTLASENQWSGNKMIRKAKIEHFTQQLQQCLTAMKYSGTCPYSIVYRTIARQANRLAANTADRKLLLVYSDLYENDTELNFYDTHTINRLQKSPQSIATQLEATIPLKQLSGLQLWLLYNPTSFSQNNRYMIVANFYQHLFSTHGAITHVANKFQPL
jgi:hypothetical protein